MLIAPLCLIGLAGCDNMAGPSYSSTPAVQQAETGVIVGVRTVQVAGANSTAGGAIAGGLAGAVIGNQFGKGSGNALMTGAGAIGGALLGQQMANNMARPQLSRQWTVRLDGGGSVAVIQNSNNLYVGQHVRLVQDSNGAHLEPM
ncbi:glycine zipper 2TM domain-containing protein [Solirhodobacter olei]|uniref:glycine zipper 2TM domain-containing protein n=1 Tax=Solirhodobacter olei TaxID=2493082 RepID=UPI0013E38046|nr:glycine zipper 2TM domain-containing protein [Solirhodobacter olei]